MVFCDLLLFPPMEMRALDLSLSLSLGPHPHRGLNEIQHLYVDCDDNLYLMEGCVPVSVRGRESFLLLSGIHD